LSLGKSIDARVVWSVVIVAQPELAGLDPLWLSAFPNWRRRAEVALGIRQLDLIALQISSVAVDQMVS